MEILIKLKEENKQEVYKNIWEVQSNKPNKEIILVGYDHLIHFKGSSEDITSLEVKFE